MSASLPIARAIELLAERGWLFVLDGDRVTTILTPADMQQPPISLFVFGLVTVSEAGLDVLIMRETAGQFLDLLTERRRVRIEEVFKARAMVNAEISMVECLNLDDRLSIARKVPSLTKRLAFESAKSFRTWEKELKAIRDGLAHGSDLLTVVGSPAGAFAAIERLQGFASRIWSLVHDDVALWEIYAQTDVRAELDTESTMLTGSGASPLPASVVYVVTAWNPGSRPLPLYRNERLLDALERRLQARGLAHWPALGSALHGRWSEQSFLVAGIERTDACSLAAEFGQRAIFELTDDELRVIDCENHQVRAARLRQAK